MNDELRVRQHTRGVSRSTSRQRYSGALHFGRPVYVNKFGEFRYSDNDERVRDNPRPCPKCNLACTAQGWDPCLGYIPGANSVCCGHGVEPAHIFVTDLKRFAEWAGHELPEGAA